jgi:hypothetical protein
MINFIKKVFVWFSFISVVYGAADVGASLR